MYSNLEWRGSLLEKKKKNDNDVNADEENYDVNYNSRTN